MRNNHMAAKNDSGVRAVNVPMAGTSADSVRNARINSSVTYGVSGSPRRFGVNEPTKIAEAEALANARVAAGVRIVTGRNRHSKFTGS
jgi:hypothetical protein